MNKEEFRNKLNKLNECVKQFEEIKGEITDETDLPGCDEMMDYLLSAINSLIPDELGCFACTVDEIVNKYGDFIVECDTRRLTYAIMNSDSETIERFLGYKPEPDCDLEEAIKAVLIQMPEEEIDKFRAELFRKEESRKD